MKKIVLLLITLLIASSVFAEGLQTLGNTSKIITAYKRRTTGELPLPEAHFRLLDSNDAEFSNDYLVDLPVNARNTAFPAFSWVLSGNIYGIVTLKFTFGPMALLTESGFSETEIIKYNVVLSHTRTRIGNTTIREGEASNVQTFITNNFSDYKYKYADKVSFKDKNSNTVANPNSGMNIASSNDSMSMEYNMSTYTCVFDRNENQINNYPYNVCDYWNRYGQAVVTMKITEDAKEVGNPTHTFEDGVYYANVKVELFVN